jgi:hypothetical protein
MGPKGRVGRRPHHRGDAGLADPYAGVEPADFVIISRVLRHMTARDADGRRGDLHRREPEARFHAVPRQHSTRGSFVTIREL